MIPLTSSGVAVALFKKTLQAQGLNLRTVFGTESCAETFWNDRSGKLVTSREDRPVPMRSAFSDFIIKTAHGGRGECVYVGPTPVGDFYDIDVSSAYTTVMSMMGLVNYSSPQVCLDASAYKAGMLGFALVNVLHYPDGLRYPVLPMEGSGQTLYFVKYGLSYCTAAEIEVALRHGYELEVLHGVIFPWDDENTRPFERFVTTIRDERAKFPKGSFDNEYIKLVGNGLFGKTGQGLREKRVFDAGQMKSVELQESSITNELFLALCRFVWNRPASFC